MLADRDAVTASELARDLPITRQAVAKHLATLADAGLVDLAARRPRDALPAHARPAHRRPRVDRQRRRGVGRPPVAARAARQARLLVREARVSWRHVDRAPGQPAHEPGRGARAGPRPRAPRPHLPRHARHAARRGARQPAVQGRASCPGATTPGAATRRPRSASRRAMGDDDVASPLHRNLGVHLVRGIPPAAVFCQFMGRDGGATRGRDSNLRSNDFGAGQGPARGRQPPARR